MRSDRVVLPYAKMASTHPRRCIFFGTINPDETGYLTDSTGNRRYWPVSVTKIDLDQIREKRDQLWAEAFHLYREGHRWWLEGEENELAEAETETRGESEVWSEPLKKANLPPGRANPPSGSWTKADGSAGHVAKRTGAPHVPPARDVSQNAELASTLSSRSGVDPATSTPGTSKLSEAPGIRFVMRRVWRPARVR